MPQVDETPFDDAEVLAEKIRRGEALSSEETRALFKTADAAGLLYYRMLTMVWEQRSLSELPARLKEIIKTEAWRKWRWAGSMFSQQSLGAYLTAAPPNGVGIRLDTVEKLVADDPEALRLWRKAVTSSIGTNQHSDNITTLKPERGTSLAYTLDRLQREKPELYARVVAGELSANAAAIKAGFRKRLTALQQIEKLLTKISKQEREQVRELLERLDADDDRRTSLGQEFADR